MQTIAYSRVEDLEIKFDLEPPPSPTSGTLSAIIYMHGGGLESGARRDLLFPEWLRESSLRRGFIFIAADHRLLYASTAFDISEDMKALFAFLADPAFSEKHLPAGLSLDASPSPSWVPPGAAMPPALRPSTPSPSPVQSSCSSGWARTTIPVCNH
ncbi:hypothetical protein EVJ58_g10268 [Rhodofomes roseus]|uniref:Alpha/beta hydrolase fold-3 domain-containing protein n=1 Tax=Rhodofomes roseus TaxID=34475 RepID=A0A4Y9XRG8_9APHY|nr:hypothetical protein EVJ58_g10268 [Rhodofomes roseus]